ncbi:MAG TPA: right-handed parallel beta-helix repeat-containing protein [Acidimicrobiia bacterium]|nr:right-handed parallel beta-helix repeat-containing protein [Acidimicrobiia bacterium]
MLQAFLNRVPNDRVIQFRVGGRYRIDGTLLLANRNRLTIDGRGAMFFAKTRGGRNRAQWWIRDGSQIVFRDLWVKGANPSGGVSTGAYVRKLETQHGFHFEGVDGAELDHVRVTDVFGDFVYLGRDRHRVPSRNVWIHDSTFLRNGRQGIAVTAATNVIIEHNSFDETRRSTIDLEPNARSWHVSNVFVLDNTVGKGRLLFVASHGQGPVDNIVISGNRLVGHPLTIDAAAPGRQRRSNWVVTNNFSDTVVRSRPMRFSGIDGLDVSGNTQRVAGRQPGVVMANDCGAKVSSNQFGSGGVRQKGAQCAAALAVPTAPALLGRGISTTTVPGVGTPGPSTTSGSTAPGRGTSGSHGGLNPWFAVLIAACVLIAVAFMVRGRRHRRDT